MSRYHTHLCPHCHERDGCEDDDCPLPESVMHSTCEIEAFDDAREREAEARQDRKDNP